MTATEENVPKLILLGDRSSLAVRFTIGLFCVKPFCTSSVVLLTLLLSFSTPKLSDCSVVISLFCEYVFFPLRTYFDVSLKIASRLRANEPLSELLASLLFAVCE